MERVLTGQMMELNRLYKEMDDIYHDYAKAFGVTDTVLWVMYFVWEHKESCTQKELCREWSYISQTVNSALKSLEQKGLLRLEYVEGSRKNKRILFTEAGSLLAERMIVPLMEAENRALMSLPKAEREHLLSGMKKNNEMLRKELEIK